MEKEPLFQQLIAAYADENLTELAQLSQTAVSQFPNDDFGYYYQAESLLLQSEPDLAQVRALLSKAQQLEPSNQHYSLKLAFIEERLGNFEPAAKLYELVLSQQPDHSEALAKLGLYYTRMTDKAELGLEYLNKAIAADDENPTYYGYRAEACLGFQLYEEALADASYSLYNQFEPSVALLKIEILRALGRDGETEPILEQLVEEYPENADYAFDYGQYMLSIGENAAAADYLQQALDNLPESEKTSPLYLSPLAQAKLNCGFADEAAELFKSCLATEPENTEWLLLLSDAHTACGEYTEALGCLDKMLKISQDDEDLAESLQPNRGFILLQMGKEAEALAIYQKLAQSPAYETDAAYGLGLVAHKKGDLAAAYPQLSLAARNGSRKANELIKSDFAEHLQALSAQVRQQHSADLAKNAASPVAQKLNGSIWQFEQVKSPMYDELEADMQAGMLENIKAYSIVFGADTALLSTGDSSMRCFYKVDREKDGLVQISFLPIDGAAAKTVKFKLDGNALSYNPEEGTFYKLRKTSAAEINPSCQYEFANNFLGHYLGFVQGEAAQIVEQLLIQD